MTKKNQKLNIMKNIIFAVLAIATVTLFASCEASNDPGYEGPSCNNCGNGGGGGSVVVTVGGGGNGGGGFNSSETFDAFVYNLPAGGRIGVDRDGDGANDLTVDAHQNLYGDLNSECFNMCPASYIKRAVVSVCWIQNTYGEWRQVATYSTCANYLP